MNAHGYLNDSKSNSRNHPDCLKYVVVHEITHPLECNHAESLATPMDGFLPDWRARRDLLNGAPLADETWRDGERL